MSPPPAHPFSPLALSALTIAALITPNQAGRYKRRGRRRRIGTKSEKEGKKRHHITVSGYPSPYLTRRTFFLVRKTKKKNPASSSSRAMRRGWKKKKKQSKTSRGPGLWISFQVKRALGRLVSRPGGTDEAEQTDSHLRKSIHLTSYSDIDGLV